MWPVARKALCITCITIHIEKPPQNSELFVTERMVVSQFHMQYGVSKTLSRPRSLRGLI